MVAKKDPPGKGKGKGKPTDPDQITLDDPEEERLRLRRLQEKADEDIIDDLFDQKKRNDLEDDLFGDDKEEEDDVEIQYDITDTFDEVTLDTDTAQRQFSKEVFAKATSCPAKGAVHKFLYELMKECADGKEGEKNLKIADCEELQKKLMTVLKEKRKANADKTLAEKKANDMTKKNAKIDVHSEMAMMYGGGDEDYDDEEDY
jgi:hypothetical protein